MEMLGNTELWKLHKTAFLSSRKVPAAQVLKCYDRDVLHSLLKGEQPVVVVLARGMKKKLEAEILFEVEKGRLLVVAPFVEGVTRVTRKTANARNDLVLEHAPV